MKYLILILFLGLQLQSFCQEKDAKVLQALISDVMDKNAEILKRETKAYSASIGIVKDGVTYTRHYGEIDKGMGNKANDTTVFEIASVTKIFVGTLVAQAVLDKKLDLDKDIRQYITGSYPNLEYKATPVRLKDLVSFKSGFREDLPDRTELMKKMDDSTTFKLKKMYESYSKEHFFNDLKMVTLDTFPGLNYKYHNASLDLAAHFLENSYQKSFDTILNENIIYPLNLRHTGLDVGSNVQLANGYNSNFIKMPHVSKPLWGAAGSMTSCMQDITRFLAFELDNKNPIVQESQRNLLKSNTNWNGYFWDNISVNNHGLNCWKHGGGFGVQNLFVLYPELGLGISVIVNIMSQETIIKLFKTVSQIVEDIENLDNSKVKKLYGYKLTKDTVVFRYEHPKKLDLNLVNNVTVVGSFNDWNIENPKYQMLKQSDNAFELRLPKSHFVKSKNYQFKFVINNDDWIIVPGNVVNVEKGGDRNLILMIK